MDARSLYQSVEHQLPLFYRSWWLDAVCSAPWDVCILRDDTGAVSAVWPFEIQSRAGLKLLRNPPLTPYLGPYDLKTGFCSDDTFHKLEQQVPRTAFRQWTGFPSILSDRACLNKELPLRWRRTFLLDLQQTLGELWSRIHSKRRNDIRKGEIDLQIESGFPEVAVFVDWQRAAFEGKGKKYPYEAAFIQNVLRAAADHHASLALTARDRSGAPQACVWLVFDNRCMYYLLSATPGKAHRGAVAVLLWEAVQRAKHMGLSVFDFEGSMDPDIARFFERFGGVEQQYEEIQETSSLLWKLKQRLWG